MAVEDAFYDDPDFRTRAFAQRPVNGHALAHLRDQLRRDDFEFVIAHGFHRALIRGQGIVEGDFIISQAEVLAALCGGIEFLGEADEFYALDVLLSLSHLANT